MFLANLHFIFSEQLFFLGLLFFVVSIWYGKRKSTFIFLLFFLIGIFGSSLFLVCFMVASLYSIGYMISVYIFQRKTYEITNIIYGLISLFIPIAVSSILSATKLTNYTSLFSQTGYAITVCTAMMAFCLVFFIYKEFLVIDKKFNEKLIVHKNKDEQFLSNLAIFIFLILLFTIINYSSIPLINYDDMGTHYPLQHRFANASYPSFDVSLHVWAVSQWVFDLYYGLFEYFFPTKGRSYLNTILALVIASIIFRCLQLYVSNTKSLFFTIVCCSTPLFSLALTTSQTELISLLLLTSLIYSFLNYHSKTFIETLPVLAFAVAIKPSNVVLFIFPLIAMIFVENKKYKLALLKQKTFWFIAVLSAIFAFITYIFAYHKTGNPFFPLFNGYFKAANFPSVNFFNALYSGHFGINAFWGLIFNTSAYLESYDYAAGFQLLFLPIVLCMIPFCFKQNKKVCLLFLSVVAGGVVLFHSQQYARYLMPCIVVLPVFYVALFKRFEFRNRLLNLILEYSLLIVCLVNVFFIPNVIWYLKNWENKFTILNYAYNEQPYELDAILSANNYLNLIPGNKVVAYPLQKPYAANFNGKYIYINWYNTAAHSAMLNGNKDLENYLKLQGVTHLIIDNSIDNNYRSIVRDFGVLIYDANGYQIYKLSWI